MFSRHLSKVAQASARVMFSRGRVQLQHQTRRFVGSSSEICTHLHKVGKVDPSAFIAPNTSVMGEVNLGPDSSIFYGCTVRADINSVTLGARSNLQDNSVIHLASNQGVVVGEDVTVGHQALLHACTIGDRVLIGMGAIVMDDAVIGEDSIVAAGALVSKGKVFPPRSLLVGSPAKVVREVTDKEAAFILESAAKYVKVAAEHKAFNATATSQNGRLTCDRCE
jgi:carbonic anhydrase/acetyltransferase-like protein (isoleucine patch superfamily)